MRECVPVGAGTSTRTDIGTHDALELGKYRADSFASHGHTCSDTNTNHTHSFKTGGSDKGTYDQGFSFKTGGGGTNVSAAGDFHGQAYGSNLNTGVRYNYEGGWAENMYHTVNIRVLDHTHSGTTGACNGENSSITHSHTINNNGGKTTHGKQVAFNYIIKY